MPAPERDIQPIVEITRALVAIPDGLQPQRFYRREPAWRLLAFGLLARACDATEDMANQLQCGERVRAISALRSSYEATTRVCWLLIDPQQNLKRWVDTQLRERLKLHNDAMSFGHRVLTDRKAAAYKKLTSVPLTEMAEEVDEYWGSQPGLGFRHSREDVEDILTFRGLYLGVFRLASNYTHGGAHAIDGYVDTSVYPSVLDRGQQSIDLWVVTICSAGVLHLALALRACSTRLNEIPRATVDAVLDMQLPALYALASP
jgi:Family of unknown function (DUF5677)